MTLLVDTEAVARAGAPDREHHVFRCITVLKHGCTPDEITPEQLERIQSAVTHTAICSPVRDGDDPEESRDAKAGHFLARAGITGDHPRLAEIMRYVDSLTYGDVTFPGLVRQGVYRHFKGGRYSILFKAHDCEDPTRLMVVYMHQDDGSMWVRGLTEFVQIVEWPDGRLRSRFVREPR